MKSSIPTQDPSFEETQAESGAELDSATKKSLGRLASLIRSQSKAIDDAGDAEKMKARLEDEELRDRERRAAHARQSIQSAGEDDSAVRASFSREDYPTLQRVETRLKEEARKRGAKVYSLEAHRRKQAAKSLSADYDDDLANFLSESPTELQAKSLSKSKVETDKAETLRNLVMQELQSRPETQPEAQHAIQNETQPEASGEIKDFEFDYQGASPRPKLQLVPRSEAASSVITKIDTQNITLATEVKSSEPDFLSDAELLKPNMKLLDPDYGADDHDADDSRQAA